MESFLTLKNYGKTALSWKATVGNPSSNWGEQSPIYTEIWGITEELLWSGPLIYIAGKLHYHVILQDGKWVICATCESKGVISCGYAMNESFGGNWVIMSQFVSNNSACVRDYTLEKGMSHRISHDCENLSRGCIEMSVWLLPCFGNACGIQVMLSHI